MICIPLRLGCEYCTKPSDTYRVLRMVDARLNLTSCGRVSSIEMESSSAYIDGTFRSGLKFGQFLYRL